MRQAGFLYYGYDRDTYLACTERISATNRQHALMVNLWFIINNLLYVVFSLRGVFGVSRKDTLFYSAYLIVSAIYGLVLLFFRKKVGKYSSAMVYISVVMLMIYGIEASVSKPYMSATMFPLFVALCLLDLDSFKQINDRLGHQMGDKAIQTTGTTILEECSIDESERWSFPERVMREQGSFAGRLGGDEFIILIRGNSGYC